MCFAAIIFMDLNSFKRHRSIYVGSIFWCKDVFLITFSYLIINVGKMECFDRASINFYRDKGMRVLCIPGIVNTA